MEELDKAIFTMFTMTANSLSQLYSLAQAQQKMAFEAGERHGLEKFRDWILERNGSCTEEDIMSYIQNEIGYGGMTSMVFAPQAHQHPAAAAASILSVPASSPLQEAPHSSQNYYGETSQRSQTSDCEMTAEGCTSQAYTLPRVADENGEGSSHRFYR